MSAPGYDSYRESGVRHIGDLPTHWSLVALKRVATFTYGDALAADVRGEGDIKVFGSNGPVGTHSAPNTSAPVVFVGRKGSCGALTWSDAAGFAIDTVYYVDPSCCRADLRWLYWTLHTLGLENSSQDTGVPGLSREVAHSSPVPLPPPAEQVAIAAFLDRETDKIDALVEAQTRLIELLKEKRQAVISCAVTKGLDPAAPMKDSGVEWLGQVPAHWDVCQLKHLVFFQRGHDLPAQDRRAGDIPIYSSGGLLDYHDKAVACGPAIVTGRYGSIGEFTLVNGPYWPLNTALYSIELPGYPAFTRYVLESLRPLFLMYAAKSAVPGVDRNDVHRLLVAIPDLDEQKAIADNLDQQSVQWQALLDAAQAAIALLQERRAALISAAVTGKIDVRGLAPEQAEAA